MPRSRCPVRMLLAIGCLTLPSFAFPAEQYIFSAPPRESRQQGVEVYEPVAVYLSAATGKTIRYQHPGNWLSYQSRMQKGEFDLVYDGPHFVAWRIDKLGHEPLATLADKLSFVIAVRGDHHDINKLEDPCGHRVCGFGPPNFATLTMYSLFTNPFRQPALVEVKTIKEAHEGVLAGRCKGAVLRTEAFAKLHKNNPDAKVIHRTDPVANQTFTAGPRFSAEDKAAMTAALLDDQARVPLGKFLTRFNKGKDLIAARRSDYQGLTAVLEHTWGF